ncbi:hypothetical protein AQJ67_17710 [Streptomyces caeruleatus]|uniref:Uncharacterized protein n=1 Tax=Streptomyces caeruleatus TaxID=661399 RepID=A0A117RQE9_9ACTN|nr:hypothetical protein AQJ67_17710 [Streptomyces caeruleatus]
MAKVRPSGLNYSSYTFMADFRRELMPQFSTSRYGIMVFFLVSGYIVPASASASACTGGPRRPPSSWPCSPP